MRALTRFSSITLHTGFVTGTLVKWAEEFTKFLTWGFDELRKPGHSAVAILLLCRNQKPFRVSVGLGAIWILYVAGACCGALGQHKMLMESLSIPIAGLVVLILVDLYRPLGMCEEQEQSNLSI